MSENFPKLGVRECKITCRREKKKKSRAVQFKKTDKKQPASSEHFAINEKHF